MGVFDAFRHAHEVKRRVDEIERLFGAKRLVEAVRLSDELFGIWGGEVGWLERQARRAAFGDAIARLERQVPSWKRTLGHAREMGGRMRAELVAANDPFNFQPLLATREGLQEAIALVADDEELLDAQAACEAEIAKRKQFQDRVAEGEGHEAGRFFKLAFEAYAAADAFYLTEQIRARLESCSEMLEQEAAYETAYQKAQALAAEDRFRSATVVLGSALAEFERAEGTALHARLQRLAHGQRLYHQGLEAERRGDLEAAARCYVEAVKLGPEQSAWRLRIAVLAARTEHWSILFEHTNDVPGEQAAYLRGLAYAKQGNWQEANREWRLVTADGIEAQREVIRVLSRRERLSCQQKIEQLVTAGDLRAARAAAEDYETRYGTDLAVDALLRTHIVPRLELEAWQGPWSEIGIRAERVWQERQDATALHNWAVAAYYQAQESPQAIEGMVAAWPMAIANLERDPSLNDVPWLVGQPDRQALAIHLGTVLEEVVEAFKDKDLETYLHLRDWTRVDAVATRLMGSPPSLGPKIGTLGLTPGAMRRLADTSAVEDGLRPSKADDASVLEALYTVWGPALAACLENDAERAAKLRPGHTPETAVEKFAHATVAYYEGCRLLHARRWREALSALEPARVQLTSRMPWREELDRLCGLQRQAIGEATEHLAFAQAWFDLLGTQAARSYLVEFKAHEVRKKLAEERISLQAGIKDLEELRKLDSNNPIILELLDMTRFMQEAEEIDRLLKRGEFERALTQAKLSKQERVRRRMAELVMDMLFEGLDRRDMHPNLIRELASHAYQLCPGDPTIRDVYFKTR